MVYCTRCDHVRSDRAVPCPSCGSEHWARQCRAAVAAIVESNISIVPWCVKRFLHQTDIDRIGYDDAIGVGNIALVRAAQYFDPSRGFKFVTLATHAVRHLLWQARDQSNRQPRPFQWNDGFDTDGGSLVPDHRQDKTGALVDAEQIDRALSRLSPRHREIVEAYYLHGENMRAIADRIGVTRARVEQILKTAIAHLRGEPLVRKRRHAAE